MAAQLVFTAEQRKAFKDQFADRNKDNDIPITPEEMDKVMRSMGINMEKEEIDEIFSDADANRDGTLDYHELLMSAAAKVHNRSCTTRLYIRAFKDLDKDRNGALSLDEVCLGMLSVDPKMTKEAITEMFKNTDRNESGYIDYREFVKMITTGI